MNEHQSGYIDGYPTCEETFVTLRILHPTFDPRAVTGELGIEPSEVQQPTAPDASAAARPAAKPGGWFLSSSGMVDSRDMRRHLDWLLDRMETKEAELKKLRGRGFQIDVSCYWLSATGQGGPTLSAYNIARLAQFDLDLWIDVYFLNDAPEN